MSNTRQRKHNLLLLGMYFAEKNKILSQDEYINSSDKPILLSGIRNIFRSYSRMVEMLKANQPELIALIGTKKVEPPKADTKSITQPKAAVLEKPSLESVSTPKPVTTPRTTASVKPASAVKTEV